MGSAQNGTKTVNGPGVPWIRTANARARFLANTSRDSGSQLSHDTQGHANFPAFLVLWRQGGQGKQVLWRSNCRTRTAMTKKFGKRADGLSLRMANRQLRVGSTSTKRRIGSRPARSAAFGAPPGSPLQRVAKTIEFHCGIAVTAPRKTVGRRGRSRRDANWPPELFPGPLLR